MENGEVRGGAKGRREALLRISSYLAKTGTPPDIALAILTGWNATNTPPLEASVFLDTYRWSFRKADSRNRRP